MLAQGGANCKRLAHFSRRRLLVMSGETSLGRHGSCWEARNWTNGVIAMSRLPYRFCPQSSKKLQPTLPSMGDPSCLYSTLCLGPTILTWLKSRYLPLNHIANMWMRHLSQQIRDGRNSTRRLFNNMRPSDPLRRQRALLFQRRPADGR